jgi:hypothetical protein
MSVSSVFAESPVQKKTARLAGGFPESWDGLPDLLRQLPGKAVKVKPKLGAVHVHVYVSRVPTSVCFSTQPL